MGPSPLPLVITRCISAPVPIKKIRRAALLLYRKERVPLSRTTAVVFCSDGAIRRLNARFRNVDRATDVLSFAFGDEDMLGEIYISTRRAEVQARQYEWSRQDEILRLFIHGFYHLLGYGHQTVRECLVMEEKERTAFTAVSSAVSRARSC
jgi:rRNA maturation RNase YbeY